MPASLTFELCATQPASIHFIVIFETLNQQHIFLAMNKIFRKSQRMSIIRASLCRETETSCTFCIIQRGFRLLSIGDNKSEISKYLVFHVRRDSIFILCKSQQINEYFYLTLAACNYQFVLTDRSCSKTSSLADGRDIIQVIDNLFFEIRVI